MSNLFWDAFEPTNARLLSIRVYTPLELVTEFQAYVIPAEEGLMMAQPTVCCAGSSRSIPQI